MTTTTETRIATAHIGTGAATHAIARRYTLTLADGYTIERVNLMCGADRRDPLAVSEFPPAGEDTVTCARCRAAMQKRHGLAQTVDVEVEAAEEAEAPEAPAAEAPEAEVPAAERRTTARRRPAGAPRLRRVANPARAAAKAKRAAVVAEEWRAIREQEQQEKAAAEYDSSRRGVVTATP